MKLDPSWVLLDMNAIHDAGLVWVLVLAVRVA